MRYLTPFQRMIIGFAAVILGAVGLIIGFIVTLWFVFNLGLLVTLTMYVILLLMTSVSLVYWQVKRHKVGFRSLAYYDPDAADEAGSTARGGFPHDPFGIVPKHPYSGRRRRPPA